jgi:hypothetical protein
MTQLSPSNLDKAFALLVDHAIIGARCPVTSGPSAHPLLISAHFSGLARQGRIRVEIGGHNWRRITILTGRHAGTSTAPNPNPKAGVSLTIDKRGRLTRSELFHAGRRPVAQPLMPAELSR